MGAIDRCHQDPIVTALFAGYSVAMVRQANKEIIGWYKDILGGHLLDNFSLRWGFVTETMFRNDFRFFPLAHQDLHLLSWFTPYVNVWMLVNAAELFTIVVIGAKTAERLGGKVKQPATLLAFSILFLFDAATGFTFFQFIYSERIVVLLLSLFCFYYTRFFQTNQTSDQYLCLLTALLGLFFKDTGFLLFTVPAFTVLIAGCMGLVDFRNRVERQSVNGCRPTNWNCASADSPLCLPSVSSISAISPPLCRGGGLRLASALVALRTRPAPDGARPDAAHSDRSDLQGQAGLLRPRCLQCWRHHLCPWIVRDGGLSVEQLHGTTGAICFDTQRCGRQLVHPLDVADAWRWDCGQSCSGLIGLEHLERQNFAHRITKQIAQDSWVKTLERMDQISRQALMDGEDINIIYSKSWFRNRGHLERLRFNRLIYYDIDLQTYTVVDGTDKGSTYKPAW